MKHNDSIFDVQFRNDDEQLLLASADEFAYVRDLNRFESGPIACLRYHQGTVKTARWRSDSNDVIVTGSRDGDIAVWDLRVNRSAAAVFSTPEIIYPGCHRKKVGDTCTGIVQAQFLPGQPYLIASIGQPDHSIKFWDCRYKWSSKATPIPVESITPIMTGTRERAYTSFTIDNLGSSLYAIDTSNKINSFSLNNFSSTPIRSYDSPNFKTGSFFMKLALSPDDEYLASGSLEENSYVWPVVRPWESFRLPGHYKEVTAVDWSVNYRGGLQLMSCGEDGSMNLWEEYPDESLVGFGEPVYHRKDRPISTCDSPSYAEFEGEPYLKDWPLRIKIEQIENIRPSTPPNLIIPSSLRSSTCKKSVISDYFKPLNQTNMTEHLLKSLKSSPFTSGIATPKDRKRPFSLLPFCSPLRPHFKNPPNASPRPSSPHLNEE